MDKSLLATSSKTVRESAKELGKIVETEELYLPQNSPVFYFLDRFGSGSVNEFIEKWPNSEFEPMGMAIETPEIITYLIKIHRNHGAFNGKQKRIIQDMIDKVIQNQNVHGQMSNYHSKQLRALILFDPKSEPAINGVSHLTSEVIPNTAYTNRSRRIQELANGIISLCELDYYTYENEIEEAASQIRDLIDDGPKNDDLENIYDPSNLAIALSKLQNYRFEFEQKLSEVLMRELSNRDDLKIGLDDIDGLFSPYIIIGKSLVGLLALGKGPKAPIYQNDWEKELERQRLARSKASFVSTLPASELQSRRIEIYEKAYSIINSVQSELRISTLMMDMFYNEILDLIEQDSDVQVRILARREGPKGERRRMKEAVMKELVKAGESEIVRGDHLLHSRMIIGDDSELLVSSADLTRDRLYDEFNAGIYTRDPDAVNEAIEYFDNIWNQGKSLDVEKY
ncbi:MAG: phospholipase D-like domain-containing protein [Halodesulfurarchaeum sp.]|nr:phospholipase D-like domain-containing protein [Halodesulfurarchaeum sp.]